MKRITNYFLGILTISIVTIYMLYHKELSLYLFPDNLDRIGELTKLLLSIIGGLGIFYGLIISNKRALITEKSVLKQGEQIELARKSQIDERFKNAVEHLGNDKEPIILGGVAELVQIAKEDQEKYSEVVFNILCSYIRSKTNIDTQESSNFNPTIIKTILNYLFKIDDKNPFKGLNADLSNTNLLGQDIDTCDFTGANLSSTYLSSVSNSIFEECNLNGAIIRTSSFTNNILNGASLYDAFFTMVEFKNSEFKSRTQEQKIFLSAKFTNCKFINFSFDDTNFFQSNFVCCIFKNCTFKNSDIMESKFVLSSLSNCDFSQINVLASIDFRGSVFNEISFNKKLIHCNFSGTRIDKPESIFISFDGFIEKFYSNENKVHQSSFPNTTLVKCNFSPFAIEDERDIKNIMEELVKTDKIRNQQVKGDKNTETPVPNNTYM